MDTSDFVESPGRRTHRHHSDEFKAQVIRACRQPGVSVASVALANGLNANMLRRWLSEAGRADPVAARGQGAVAARAAAIATANTSGRPAFVAVQMPAPPAVSAEPDIHIEFTRGSTTIVMRWPSSLAGACASCLREMLR
jgi:transposase